MSFGICMKLNNKYNYSNSLYIDYDQKYFLAHNLLEILIFQ